MVETIRIEARLIHPNAKLPTKSRATDAGYDIYAISDFTLKPNSVTVIKTGIQISVPPGYYYTTEGRSSLMINGVYPHRYIIDSTYCGELVVSLVNANDSVYHFFSLDRIAQIVLSKQYDADFNIVQEFSQLYNQRGNDGFGSTGR